MMHALRPALLLALVHCGPGKTDTDAATTGTGPDTGTSSTTTATATTSPTSGGAPECSSSSECPAGEACIEIPCSVSPVAGCDAFHCQPGCGWPYDETFSYGCVDGAGCCQDAFCDGGSCVHVSEPFSTGHSETTSSTSSSSSASDPSTSSSSTGDPATSTGETTGAPPACVASSDCPGDGNCLLKPCELVMDELGCGEFHCYAECSDPFSESGLWTCADDDACCGFACLDGVCTEMFSSET